MEKPQTAGRLVDQFRRLEDVVTDTNALRSSVRLPGQSRSGASVHVLVVTAVDPFPTSSYPDPFALDSVKFQPALVRAIANAETRRGQTTGSFPIPFTMAEVTSGSPPFPMCGYRDSEVDYIASEAKVAVMYAAYELRSMVRRFVAANPSIPQAQLFSQMAAVQNGKFKSAVPLLNSARNITDAHRLGGCAGGSPYSDVFSPTPNAAGLIDFTDTYKNNLKQMIVPSSNGDAMACIHGIGYSYLNGALAAGGFFVGTGGVWIASDYQFGKVWPPVRAVTSNNDGMATLTGTTRQMARLMALMHTKTLVDGGAGNGPGAAGSSTEMLALLRQAAQGPDSPWTSRDGRIPVSNFICNKLGLGPKGSGPKQFRSEVSLIKDVVASGRTYAVAWQNLLELTPYDLGDMTSIILDTITEFER